MRIGLSTAAYYGVLETEEAASHVASLGVPCCEVFLETFSEYTAAFGQDVSARLGKTDAISIHSKTQHFEGDIIGLSAKQRKDAFAWMESFLQAGQAMGAKIYVFHGPAAIRTTRPDFARWQEPIAQAIALCASYGIQFAWETVSWCQLNEPARVRSMSSIWPNLRYVLDFKQVYQMGQAPVDYIEVMGDRLCHIHALDYDADGMLVLPGQGVHDFGDISRALSANGYQGDIILEPYANTANNDEALLTSIQWLRETFQAD